VRKLPSGIALPLAATLAASSLLAGSLAPAHAAAPDAIPPQREALLRGVWGTWCRCA